jgi:hypothetical protein
VLIFNAFWDPVSFPSFLFNPRCYWAIVDYFRVRSVRTLRYPHFFASARLLNRFNLLVFGSGSLGEDYVTKIDGWCRRYAISLLLFGGLLQVACEDGLPAILI